MLLIVAHHYVVNSGLLDLNGPIYSDLQSGRSMFYLLFGAWGKTGINCFVLITGYYMCKSQITVKKFVKLLAEVMFYRISIWLAFLLSGYEAFSITGFVKMLLPVSSIQTNFTGCFLVFYLFIPFLNILIRNMNEKEHLRLLALCSFTYILFGTFHKVAMNYVSWFVVIYMIGSYIRSYPKPLFDQPKLWAGLTILSVTASIFTVVCCAWFGGRFGMKNPYVFLQDSNTFLAVTNGLCSFMFFKNLKIPQSHLINTIAASTFGVLCIHANSNTMRRWLWKDVLNNVGMYDRSCFAVHAVLSVVGIFSICILIDYLRIRFVENPFLNKYGGIFNPSILATEKMNNSQR